MRNVVDVSSLFLMEVTGDSEADPAPHPSPVHCEDDGEDKDEDDVDDIDAESRSSKTVSKRSGHHKQLNCCTDFVRAWIEEHCCKAVAEEDEGEEEEVCLEKKVQQKSAVPLDSDVTMDEQEKSRRFWETCLAS